MSIEYLFDHWKGWAVKRSDEHLFLHTISDKRAESICLFEEDDVGSWKRWYGRGFRCVKVRIVEVEE